MPGKRLQQDQQHQRERKRDPPVQEARQAEQGQRAIRERLVGKVQSDPLTLKGWGLVANTPGSVHFSRRKALVR